MAFHKTILVAEDNELNRAILVGILEEHYNVLEAENGKVALDLLRAHAQQVSLILLDVMMPVMDGYTFLDHMKAEPALSHIPVIVTTQGTSEQDELEALNHGATDFVPKPYRPQIILHRIAALIQLHEASSMVSHLQYDGLTGLYTKEYFYQQARRRLNDDPMGEYNIVCSNIENFKLVNDIFGVEAGNRLLREVAEKVKEVVGTTGFAGRLSADRFLAFQRRDIEQEHRKGLYIDTDNVDDPASLLKSVNIRFGIYEVHDKELNIEQMCDRALLAANSIKNQYRKHFAVYDDSLRTKLLREQELTADMETALEGHQFSIYLQPKYDLKRRRMCGAEALMRWIHPEKGFISPGEFIPLFERNGFISRLDQFVWEQICIFQRNCMDKGLPMLPISVNISRADVFHIDLAETITALTKKYGVSPAFIHLEITESAYTENPEQVVNAVDKLRAAGFIVEMDDFGSGYSSLNMLSRMSLDIVKLDMEFVRNELAKPVMQSLMSNVIGMAHQSGLRVVAEGVETREQMNRLRTADCDYVQGYFFARPMPVNDYEQLLVAEQAKNLAPLLPESQRKDNVPTTLMIIDENDEYRATVRTAFADRFEILEAADTESAISLLRTDRARTISALVLSTTLPDGGTDLVVKELRQKSYRWEVPVLALIDDGGCTTKVPLFTEADDFLCRRHPAQDMLRRIQNMITFSSFHKKDILLQDAANCDALTGLLNRRGFHNAMSTLNESDMPLAICLFDLDGLKRINEENGYDMGDQALAVFASVLRSQTRNEDVKCRFGDDEFVVVMRHSGRPEDATKKAERICSMFAEQIAEDGCDLTCSAGIAICAREEKPYSEMVIRADRALFNAKRDNKGHSLVWEED
ncbi:MAG: EAL domain-containing protein [Clostridia bacterium]|nr:EAL domain-containing protein [Clostridia bacterium]